MFKDKEKFWKETNIKKEQKIEMEEQKIKVEE
jgi:hypothetical protein